MPQFSNGLDSRGNGLHIPFERLSYTCTRVHKKEWRFNPSKLDYCLAYPVGIIYALLLHFWHCSFVCLNNYPASITSFFQFFFMVFHGLCLSISLQDIVIMQLYECQLKKVFVRMFQHFPNTRINCVVFLFIAFFVRIGCFCYLHCGCSNGTFSHILVLQDFKSFAGVCPGAWMRGTFYPISFLFVFFTNRVSD